MQEMDRDGERLLKLRRKLEQAVTSRLDTTAINGHAEKRLPHITNISFGFVEGESLMMALKEIACSSGSACTSASLEPSYVLKSLGVGDDLAHSSLRLSLGKWTTEEQVDYTNEKIVLGGDETAGTQPAVRHAQRGHRPQQVEWAHH